MSDSERERDRAWQTLDGVLQASLVEQRRARRWGVFFKLLTFGYLIVAVLLFYPGRLTPAMSAGEHTAVVRVEGTIAADQHAAADTVAQGLRRAFEHGDTRAVLLVINSPGGSPVQAEYIYKEMQRLRAEHDTIPLYAVIGDVGASGAYYIAAAAERIYASPASLIGSIGVVSGSFGFVEAMDKVGVERRLFTAGEHKGLLDPFSPLQERDAAFWQSVLQETHELFVERVKSGRGERLAKDSDVFSGLLWGGRQARELGLVDDFGSPGEVARDVVGVERTVDFTVRPDPLQALFSRFGTAVGRGAAQALQWQAPALR